MKKHPVLLAIFTSLFLSLTLLIGIFTDGADAMASIFNREVAAVETGIILDPSTLEKHSTEGEWSHCLYEAPEESELAVDLLSVDINENIQPGDIITVNMTFMNTGNTRLFSENSDCDADQPILNVGTQMDTDRSSIFGRHKYAVSGWLSPNRIEMEETYADPEETFQVMFSSIAPDGDDIYREFFQPVVEGHAWLDEAFILDFEIGTPTESMRENIAWVADAAMQASRLEGLDRHILIDLSDQLLSTMFGDIPVWSMTVSSGHWETPTPPGNYNVIQKQELRIGGAWPHYRMPYWLGFRWDGYGIHALPYLANDGGTFWQEALTHIGIPVSHGCVRVLPDDARTLFEFAEVGMPITVTL